MLKENKGFALIMVILILSVLVAVVAEFVYIVYTETVSLYNWRDLQRLSLEAETGITVGESLLDKLKRVLDAGGPTYPDRIDLPVLDVGEEGTDAMLVSIIDENAKININKMVNANNTLHEYIYPSFKRMLNTLDIDETIADRIVDWIDADSEETASGAEQGAKNGYLYSIDELLSIEGISEEIYKKLLPRVTIFGDGLVNINSADGYVLMSLADGVSTELAERVISYRQLQPFLAYGDLRKVAGWGQIYSSVPLGSDKITIRGSAFTIEVSALEDKLKRTIMAVLSYEGGRFVYKFWKEI